MTPHWGNTFLFGSSQQPPFLSQTLEGLFELTRRHSRALDSPCALLPELQRYLDTVRVCRAGRGGPRTLSKNLSVGLSKTHFLTSILDVKSQQNVIELVTPDLSDLEGRDVVFV